MGRADSGHRCAASLRAAVLGSLLAGWLGLALGSTATAQESCEPWDGEIAPLPRIDSDDRFEARWAELRARELEILARGLSTEDPALAYRLWSHARCLEPDLAALADLPTDLGPSVVYRERPVFVFAQSKPAPAPEPALPDFGPADRVLASVEVELAEARFKSALDVTSEARSLLEAQPDSEPRRDRLVRLEIMSATALIALGRSADAGASLARALEVKPDLELDASTTPPKVLRIFDRVRTGAMEEDR